MRVTSKEHVTCYMLLESWRQEIFLLPPRIICVSLATKFPGWLNRETSKRHVTHNNDAGDMSTSLARLLDEQSCVCTDCNVSTSSRNLGTNFGSLQRTVRGMHRKIDDLETLLTI